MSVRFAIEKFMIRLYLRYFSWFIYFAARTYLSFIRPRPYIPGTLLILKPDAAGDYILMRNFLHFIRRGKRFEGYTITFLGNAMYRDLATHFDPGEIDAFIWMDKNRIYRNLCYYIKLAKQIFHRFEVTIHPVYSREFLFDYYAGISGVKERIGFAGDTVNINPAYQKRANRWYTQLIGIEPSELHEFFRNKRFFEEVLGQSIPLKAPDFSDDQISDPGSRIPDPRSRIPHPGLPDVPEQFAVIFPGAQLGYRRWSTKNYSAICDYLHNRFQLDTLIVGGKNDARLAARIMHHSQSHPADLTGKTPLHLLPALFSRARLLITNDTVAVHLGAAVDTPTIVLSQLNHYGRFVPYPPEMDKRVVCVIPEGYQQYSASDLVHQFRNGSRVNISLITVNQVKEAIDQALSSNPDSI